MTALQTINLGTPPAASDGDTSRTANVKINGNIGVLQTQATLTSAAAPITAAGAIPASYVGQRVNIVLTVTGALTFPQASTVSADSVMLLRNSGNYAATFAKAAGSTDTVTLTALQPGECALVDCDGAGKWGILSISRNAPPAPEVETLADVVVTAPANEDVLVYSTATKEWVNSPLLGATATQAAATATQAAATATQAAATATQAAATAATVAQLAGRNRIINGDQRVNQRGITTVAAGVLTYVTDRFYVTSNGSAANVAQATAGTPAGFPFALTVSPSAAGNTSVVIGQRIERLNVSDLAGQPVAESVWLYSSVATTATLAYGVPSTADNFTTETATNIGTVQLAAGWTDITETFTLAAGASAGVDLYVTFPSVASGAKVGLTGMQFEGGTASTLFDREAYSTTLSKCQRYYWSTYDYGVAAGSQTISGVLSTISTASSAGGALASWLFPTPMRATPTLTFYSSSGAAGSWRSGGSVDVAVGNAGISPSSRAFTINNNYAIAQGTGYYGHVVASTEL